MPGELHPSLIEAKALPLLRRLLVSLRLFALFLLVFGLLRCGLRARLLLRSSLRFRGRRGARGLRALARGRSLWPLSRLIPAGLRPRIRLGYRRTGWVRPGGP